MPGIAIENARLHEQVQAPGDRRRARSGSAAISTTASSRASTAVGLSLEDVPDLMEDEPEVARARVEARHRFARPVDPRHPQLHFGLRPNCSSRPAWSAAWRPWQMSSGSTAWWTVDVETYGVEDVTSRPIRPVSCSRIAREALSNIARHSKATRGTVSVEAHNGRIRLTVSDNGVGFDPDQQRGPSHQGLINMRARAVAVGGHLVLESSARWRHAYHRGGGAARDAWLRRQPARRRMSGPDRCTPAAAARGR